MMLDIKPDFESFYDEKNLDSNIDFKYPSIKNKIPEAI